MTRPYPDGLLRKFKLHDWWMTEFTQAERDYIEEVFNPLGFGRGTLTQGHVTYTSQKAHHLLRAVAGWFRKTEQDADIARRIMLKHDQIKPGRKKPQSPENPTGAGRHDDIEALAPPTK